MDKNHNPIALPFIWIKATNKVTSTHLHSTCMKEDWRENNLEVTKPKLEVKDLTKSYQFIVRS